MLSSDRMLRWFSLDSQNVTRGCSEGFQVMLRRYSGDAQIVLR